MDYFSPNCTFPPNDVRYVGDANIRSTLDIFWSCAATLTACTYSVLHLNVPRQRLDGDSKWTTDLRWSLGRLAKKLKWCVITIFMPELILVKAMSDWLNARRQLRELHNAAPKVAHAWKLTHMLFADMGGFVLRYQNSSKSVTSGRKPSLEATSDTRPFIGDQHSLWHLDAYVLRCLIEEGLVSDVISADELWDKSKGDLFAKGLTLLQIGYFVIALLVRVGEHLSVAELEVGTAAFVVCALMTYILTLEKPKSVERAIVLHENATHFMHRVHYAAESSTAESVLAFVPALAKDKKAHRLGDPPPNDRITGDLNVVWTYLGIFLATTVFSAVHLAGWNLPFSSTLALYLWRVSALVTTGLPAFWMVFHGLMAMIFGWFDPGVPMREWMFDNTLLPVTVLYLGGRGILIEEMLRGLAYLPPDAFMATWTANVPHIG